MKNYDAYTLGATLYVPAIHQDIKTIANGIKYPNLKSVVFCTEDSISIEDLPLAYMNIEKMLKDYTPNKKLKVFIRVRNHKELENLLNIPNIEKIYGIVFPKFDTTNMYEYFSIFEKANLDLKIMPILETKEIYSQQSIIEINHFIKKFNEKILMIRIGGNDLLSIFNIRRSCDSTIYEILPVSSVITNILVNFGINDFIVSSPVWECFELEGDKLEVFKKEIKLDISNGLFGKTVIHPNQIDIVHEEYKVTVSELETAKKILDENYPSVFKLEGQMCEKTVHNNWAKVIILRSNIYGVKNV